MRIQLKIGSFSKATHTAFRFITNLFLVGAGNPVFIQLNREKCYKIKHAFSTSAYCQPPADEAVTSSEPGAK